MAQQESNPTTLERTLGLRDLILLIIGTVIGSGIFIVPGAVLRQTNGNITLAMLVWLTGGVLSLLGALTYGELSAMNPQAGGLYIFIRDGFGRLPSFLYGWTLFFVISSGSMATLAVAFSSYLGQIVPLSPLAAKLAAIAMIVVVTVVNVIGTAASKLVAAAILISIFSATNGLALTAPRVYYAMARDGVFFHQLAKIHPRFRTPAFAILAGSAWSIVLAATGTFEQLLTYVVFTGWLFYALGAASIFVYRRRSSERELPYRVPGYPWTPLLFIIAAAALVLNTIVTQFDRAAIGHG